MKHMFAALTVFCVAFASSPEVLAQAESIQFPPNVAWMYVFMQKPGTTERGSGREIATMVSPSQFRKNFSTYLERAKREKMQLIVTAETKDRKWVQDQIRYRGKTLSRAHYYNPGIDQPAPGVEIPLN